MRNEGSERCEVRRTPTALAGSEGEERGPAAKGCRKPLEAGKGRELVSHVSLEGNQPWAQLDFSLGTPVLVFSTPVP